MNRCVSIIRWFPKRPVKKMMDFRVQGVKFWMSREKCRGHADHAGEEKRRDLRQERRKRGEAEEEAPLVARLPCWVAIWCWWRPMRPSKTRFVFSLFWSLFFSPKTEKTCPTLVFLLLFDGPFKCLFWEVSSDVDECLNVPRVCLLF